MAKFKIEMAAEYTSDSAKEQVPRFLGWADKHLTEDDGSECWYWEQIKWYSDWPADFADVDFFEKFMKNLDEEDYYFIKIGEEYDDVETKGLWCDNPFGLTLTRQIVFDS